MEVQALFVRALLPRQEELAELGGTERRSNQPLVIHVLIHRQNCNGTVTRIAECHVGRVRRTSTASIIDIVCVDDDFVNLAVLTEVVKTSQRLVRGDVRCQANDIHQRLLDNSEVAQSLDLVPTECVDWNLNLPILGWLKPKRLQTLDASIKIGDLDLIYLHIRECLLAPAINTTHRVRLPIFFAVAAVRALHLSLFLLVVLLFVVLVAILTNEVLSAISAVH